MDTTSKWETFFYYGKGDIREESKQDLEEVVVQSKRSLFYYRQGSSGITEYSNVSSLLLLQVLGKFDIASSIAYRNSFVSNGFQGSIDRRIILSQTSIEIIKDRAGNVQVKIEFLLKTDFKSTAEANTVGIML